MNGLEGLVIGHHNRTILTNWLVAVSTMPLTVEIYIFKKWPKTGLKREIQKNKTTFTLTTFKVDRVKVVLVF